LQVQAPLLQVPWPLQVLLWQASATSTMATPADANSMTSDLFMDPFKAQNQSTWHVIVSLLVKCNHMACQQGSLPSALCTILQKITIKRCPQLLAACRSIPAHIIITPVEQQ
jgi:hypothetical protein